MITWLDSEHLELIIVLFVPLPYMLLNFWGQLVEPLLHFLDIFNNGAEQGELLPVLVHKCGSSRCFSTYSYTVLGGEKAGCGISLAAFLAVLSCLFLR